MLSQARLSSEGYRENECKTLTTEMDEDMRIKINSELKYQRKSDQEILLSSSNSINAEDKHQETSPGS
jgi:hypothetical protein